MTGGRQTEDKATYTSFEDLGGRRVELVEVREELARLPLDLVLGILSRLSALAVKHGDGFSDPRFQGGYLNSAIVDDFPCILRNASNMYAPGRVPITGGRHLFIHEHVLCALAKMALRHCRTDVLTERLRGSDYTRICRLLLILNDHLWMERPEDVTSLRSRRAFGVEVLFRSQFGHAVSDQPVILTAAARLRRVLLQHMPDDFDVATRFETATGMAIDTYFDVAMLLIGFALSVPQQITDERSPWTSIQNLTLDLVTGQDEVTSVVDSMTQTVAEFRVEQDDSPHELLGFGRLQTRPFIEARAEQLIIPTFTLMVRQLLAYPIQVLARDNVFLEKLGEAYENYAHELVVRIASGDKDRWECQRGAKVSPGEIDSLMSCKDSAVVVEHKARQVNPVLGDIRVLRNALGLHDDQLKVLSPAAKPKDGGAVTKPIWQLRALAPNFDSYSQESFGHSPKRVFPLAVLLESYRVEEWLRHGYLEPLMEAAGTTWPPNWAPMQWLHISDLEALAQLAEDGELDLVDLLSRKSVDRMQRFDMLLSQQFGGVRLDQKLLREGTALWERMIERLLGGRPLRSN